MKHVDMSLQNLLVEIDFPVFDHFSIQCMATGYPTTSGDLIRGNLSNGFKGHFIL